MNVKYYFKSIVFDKIYLSVVSKFLLIILFISVKLFYCVVFVKLFFYYITYVNKKNYSN